MSKTNYLEDAVLNHVLRNSAFSSPAAVYVALFTAAPGEAGGGTEVAGNGYARQASTFSAPSGGSVSNSADITFPQASGSWGTITHFALFDAVTAGNMLYYGALTTPKVISTGDQLRFAAAGLIVSED